MQLIADAVTVLGSRHGIMADPSTETCGLIRYDRFTRMPRFGLRAGAIIDGQERVLPLTPDGERFAFIDQRTATCRMRFIALDKPSNLRLELDVITPFRPKDQVFSTTPVLALRLKAEILPGIFRWSKPTVTPDSIDLVLGIDGLDTLKVSGDGDALDIHFDSVRAITKEDFSDVWDTIDENRPQHDRLIAPGASASGSTLVKTVNVKDGAIGELTAFWCTHDAPVMQVRDEMCPFLYAERFADLAAVEAWARSSGQEILDNADAVEGIIHTHDQSPSLDKFLAYTLHSWLAGSWWAKRPDGRDWFSVWEGTCYFHATVDVEFTQCPLYLAMWPELLGIQLDYWTEFALPGSDILGDKGADTAYLSHDTGAHSRACYQIYSHDMAVEETCNWLIMAAAHHRRSGDDSVITTHEGVLDQFVAFLIAADSTGNAVPDKGIANTVDDASPAVQFGTEQTYLAAKTLAAFTAAIAIRAHLGRDTADLEARCDLLRKAIDGVGWLDDHYAVLLERSGSITNPWSKDVQTFEEIPGWDAHHIYTANAFPPLDMVGLDVGLDGEHLRTDLKNAADVCLEEYGCSHSSYSNEQMRLHEKMLGLAGVAQKPGWIAMNCSRDISAAYRGVDLRTMPERYWDWQTTTNSQEARLFFETFKGNNLCFYPRGVAVWGIFDAIAGQTIDKVAGTDEQRGGLSGYSIPRLIDADWEAGTCTVLKG